MDEWPVQVPDWFPVDVNVPDDHREGSREYTYSAIRDIKPERLREREFEKYQAQCRRHVEQKLRELSESSGEFSSESEEKCSKTERKRRRLETEGIPRATRNNNVLRTQTVESKVAEAVLALEDLIATCELTYLQKQRVLRVLRLKLKNEEKK